MSESLKIYLSGHVPKDISKKDTTDWRQDFIDIVSRMLWYNPTYHHILWLHPLSNQQCFLATYMIQDLHQFF